MNPRAPVIVVGGGWAGLAAAVELAAAGQSVTLLESARQLGGRARSALFGELAVDNGQHLLIGGYRHCLRLMKQVGLAEQEVISRLPLHLRLVGGGESLDLKAPSLPAPLHLAAALLGAKGLTWGERLRALRMAATLYARRFSLAENITVSELLARHGQGERLTRLLWEPLCLGALNTPAETASARVFLRVLRDSFAHRTADSDLLVPQRDLGKLFPIPALDYIERRGGQVHLSRRVTALVVEEGRMRGVLAESEFVEASQVILAAPVPVAKKLLSRNEALYPTAAILSRLSHAPIATVYLRYPPEVTLGTRMLGLVGTLGQWVFDRSGCGQPGLMAVVISGDGPHMALPPAELARRVADELALRFPRWPSPLEQLAIREKRATFVCNCASEDARPGHETPVTGLWLAGDYTDTGYPATLEGAVLSGVQCARRAIANLSEEPVGQ